MSLDDAWQRCAKTALEQGHDPGHVTGVGGPGGAQLL
jgi:hypothetical protein